MADIEANASAAPQAMAVPTQIALHLIQSVITLAEGQAICQTQRHRRIIGPLTGFQTKRTPAYQISERLKAAWRFKFQRCAQGIASCQTHKTSSMAIERHQICSHAFSSYRQQFKRSKASFSARLLKYIKPSWIQLAVKRIKSS
jgi:hypothetical protein